MDWSLSPLVELTILGFAPYPGHVSARTTNLFWYGLAALGFAFWAFFVLGQGEWANVRAWGGFLLGTYVLYWRLFSAATADTESDSRNE